LSQVIIHLSPTSDVFKGLINRHIC